MIEGKTVSGNLLEAAVAPGLMVSHATHLTASLLLGTMHTSHSQLPVGFWKRLARLGRAEDWFCCKKKTPHSLIKCYE